MSLFNKSLTRKSLSLILVALLMGGIFLLAAEIKFVFAPETGVLVHKWTTNLGLSHGAMLLGALAADVNGDGRMEIVVTGGPGGGDWGQEGMVTALDGETGSIVWQTTWEDIPNIGIDMRTDFNIADLDQDGLPEIIIPGLKGPLVLRGTDGSLYWRRMDVPSFSNFGAVADIDGDGYPEIFVSSGFGMQRGYDYITRLSHDGNVLNQAWLWHTCWGGLTIGDADFDGQYEILQGERSNAYSPDINVYAGGGLGARALDAHTLTPLWNDPTVLDSSQAPMFADVDKDGILDVVTVHQLSNTVIVYNITDGSVLTTGGIYRKGGTPRLRFHSQPTVYDIDYDGNLEIISGRSNFPSIFDLYDWELDTTLNFSVYEPPKVGDVTGDGRMDIIAVGNSTIGQWRREIFIYSFDEEAGTYVVRGTSTGRVQAANAFTLVEDIDDDGLNELVVTSANGYIYVYDTPGQADPGVRSGLQFYGEYKTGAADSEEYVTHPTVPSKPVVRDEYPKDRSYNQSFNPTLLVRATDFQGDLMTITFSTNASGTWQNIGTFPNVPTGYYGVPTSNMNTPGTTYFWRVNVTDGVNPISRDYKFTTHSNAPTQGTPSLTNVGGDLVTLNQTTTDSDGDEVSNIYDWYVNDVPFANLHLPFDTRTSGNILVADVLFSDGFESGFGSWNGNGVTDWDQSTSQVHSGTYSAHAGSADNLLLSDDVDTSSADGITVGLWYRDHLVDDADNVFLQFWDGSDYIPVVGLGITELGISVPEDTWHHYSVQTYFPPYLREDFHIRIDGTSIDSGEELWIDDVTITTPTQAKDYSDYNNHAMVRGATWDPQGVVGGAYAFDGSNDYMKIRDDPSLGGDGTWSEISLEFWIKLDAPTSGATVLAKKIAQDNVGSYMIGFRDQSSGSPANTLFWGINNGTLLYDPVRNRSNPYRQDVWDDVNTVLTVGQWYHVVATYKSGQGLTMYINGTQRVNKPLTGNIEISSGDNRTIFGAPFFVGWDGGTNFNNDRYRWLNGTLDEVSVYPGALTPGQIMQRFIETKDGSSSGSTIVSEETTLGETWKTRITPNDSFGDGVTEFSDPLTISEVPVQYELTIIAVGDGTTDPAPGSHLYTTGTEVDLTAYADLGWVFSEWSGDLTGSANPTTILMDGNKTVTATFVMAEYTLTVNIIGDGAVELNASGPYYYGDVVELTATPDAGWSFYEWSVDLTGLANPTTIVIDGDKVVNATFAEEAYTLTINMVGSGVVNRNVTGPYHYGDVVQLAAVPSMGWSFSQWDVDLSGSANPETIVMDGDKTVNATFVQIEYTLTIYVEGGGSVTRNNTGPYHYGDVVKLTATADPNWLFSQWSVDLSGSANPETLVMDGDKVVNATFAMEEYTLTVNVVGSGSVSLNNTGPYYYGDVVNLTASADPGWMFSAWSEDLSGSENPTLLTMDGNKVVNATFAEETYTLTVNIVGSGVVNRNVSEPYYYGDAVELTAVPDAGWSFTEWSVDLSGSANPGTIIMDSDKTVNATFTLEEYTLTINVVGGGVVNRNASEPYYYGDVVELTAVANVGWSFSGWSEDLTGFANPETIVMDGHRVVNATFVMEEYTLTVNIIGSGTVDLNATGPYYYGDVVELTANPDLGWGFSGWSVDLSGNANPETLVMDGDKIVNATFTLDEYALTTNVVGSGTVTRNPDQATYTYGINVTLTAQPLVGWSFAGWSGDASGTELTTTVNMTSDKSVTATFTQDEYTLTVNVVGNGVVTRDPEQLNYTYGTEVNLTAVADLGWVFFNWTGDFIGTANPATVVIDGDMTVNATFVQIEYTLTVNVAGSGVVNRNDSGPYYYGDVVELMANADLGWVFSEWDEDVTGSTNPETIVMNGHRVVNATFSQEEYTLTINIEGSGLVNLNNSGPYHYGDVVELTANPDLGWSFNGWSVDLSGSTSPETIVIDGDKTVNATFVQEEYILTINVEGSGSVNLNDTGPYHYGDVVELSADADSGWEFLEWTGDLTGNDNPATIVMDGDKIVNATFIVLLADGFESGGFSRWTGTFATSGETATVVNTMPYDGVYGAMFSGDGEGGFEFAYSHVTISSASELYARGYFKVASSGLTDDSDRFYFMMFMSGDHLTGEALAYAGWVRVGGIVKWSLIIRDGTGWVGTLSDSSPVVDQWYSVELHWVGDSVIGHGELYVNGELVCSISGKNTAALGDVNSIRFGVAEMVNSDATTVYGDCFIASEQYIGPEP